MEVEILDFVHSDIYKKMIIGQDLKSNTDDPSI